MVVPEQLPAPLAVIGSHGYVMTSLFLALSGFMMYYGYMTPAGTLRVTARSFWKGRFAAIYPALLIGELLCVPLALVGTTRSTPAELLVQVPLALTATKAWVPSMAFALDAPAWTITVLTIGYAIFPWLATRVARLSTARTAFLLAGCWSISLLVPTLYYVVRPDAVGELPSAGDSLAHAVHAFPLVRLPEFVSGIALARLAIASEWRPERASLLASIAIATLLALLPMTENVPYLLRHNALFLPLHWAIIAGLLLAGRRGAGRILAMPIWSRAGAASLMVFTLHLPLLAVLRAGLRALGTTPPAMIIVIGYVSLVLALSIVVHERITQPLTAYVRTWLDGIGARDRRAPVTPASVRADEPAVVGSPHRGRGVAPASQAA